MVLADHHTCAMDAREGRVVTPSATLSRAVRSTKLPSGPRMVSLTMTLRLCARAGLAAQSALIRLT